MNNTLFSKSQSLFVKRLKNTICSEPKSNVQDTKIVIIKPNLLYFIRNVLCVWFFWKFYYSIINFKNMKKKSIHTVFAKITLLIEELTCEINSKTHTHFLSQQTFFFSIYRKKLINLFWEHVKIKGKWRN